MPNVHTRLTGSSTSYRTHEYMCISRTKNSQDKRVFLTASRMMTCGRLLRSYRARNTAGVKGCQWRLYCYRVADRCNPLVRHTRGGVIGPERGTTPMVPVRQP